jgi:hypothetical protein
MRPEASRTSISTGAAASNVSAPALTGAGKADQIVSGVGALS